MNYKFLLLSGFFPQVADSMNAIIIYGRHMLKLVFFVIVLSPGERVLNYFAVKADFLRCVNNEKVIAVLKSTGTKAFAVKLR